MEKSMSSRNNGWAQQGNRQAVRSLLRLDGGFTLIELLVAFTILAIVAGSLFQMFFVSARNNADAADFDTANNLAVTAAEEFKADPESALARAGAGTGTGTETGAGTGAGYIKYYDEEWRELETPFAATDAPRGAKYALEARVSASGLNGATAVPGKLSVKMDSSQEQRLVVTDLSGEIEVIFNGIPQKLGKPDLDSPVYVSVEFNQAGVLPKRVTAVNKTEMALDISVFGIPDSGLSPEREDGARQKYIEVSPAEGTISVVYLGDQAQAADSKYLTLGITVRALWAGGPELVNLEVGKYIPG